MDNSFHLTFHGSNTRLPVTGSCGTKSADFVNIVRNNIPGDIAEDVQTVIENKQKSFTPLSLLFFIAVILCFSAAFLLFLPKRSHPAVESGVSAAGLSLSSSRFREVFQKADILYQSKQYHECVQLLSPVVQNLTEGGNKQDIRRSGMVFHRYFDSVLKAADSEYIQRQKQIALQCAEMISQCDPDCVHWHLFRLQLQPEYRLDGDRYAAVSEQNYRLWKRMEQELRQFPYYRKMKYADNPDIRRQLDLFEAKFHVMIWLLTSPYSKWKQNAEAHGVVNRETAYRIAKTKPHDTEPDFLRLRYFIVSKLYHKTGLFSGQYRFDETDCFRRSVLKHEMETLKEHIREIERDNP